MHEEPEKPVLAGTLLVVGILGMVLGAAVLVAWHLWRGLNEVELGFHGWLALISGITATLGLGIGLMRLVYYSHKKGYDERAGHDD